jgi:alpha-glucosidase (family GH31 glycosyl hydrolase)
MVGADTGGFNRNTDEELANRWHSLSAFTFVQSLQSLDPI